MANELEGKKVALLVDQGFEQSELLEPKKALEEAGAQAIVVSPQKGKVKGWKSKEWGEEVPVDMDLTQARADGFDALVLPGGVMNPDRLRTNAAAVSFVKGFVDQKKPIAAICHGPWTLIEAGAVRGRKVTSWPSLRTDLMNAGAIWEDSEVVTDQGIVTSRSPEDLPAFTRKMVEEIAEGPHVKRRAA